MGGLQTVGCSGGGLWGRVCSGERVNERVRQGRRRLAGWVAGSA